MDRSGNTHFILQQDSVQTNQEEILVKVPAESTINVNAPKPSVSAIPEVPKRFQTASKPKKVEPKVFIPSAKDSIMFNLKTRLDDEGGYINNTVVRDFLEPISRSDKMWIKGAVEGKVEDYKQGVTQGSESKTELVVDEIAESDAKDSLEIVQVDDSVYKTQDRVSTEKETLTQFTETIKKELEPGKESSREYSQDILTGLIILSVAITGIIRLTNFKYLRELFSSLVFSQYARKIQKEENLHNQKAAFALSGLFLFNAALFIYEYIHYNQVDTALSDSLLLIPIAMGLILAFGLVKNILYRFVSFVFECKQETNEYIFHTRLNDKIFGLVILPVVAVIPYIDKTMLPMLFNLGVGIFVLLYFIQLFRGFVIILRDVASLFYMFLYLCALEILPLLIMYNILIN